MVPPSAMGLSLRRRVAAMEGLYVEYDAVEEDHHRKLQELEAEFAAASQKIFTRRQQIIEGSTEPTDEEVNKSSSVGDVTKDLPDPTVAADPQGIPQFWPTALRVWLKHSDVEGLEVSAADWAILDHLREVRVETWQPPNDVIASDADGEPLEGDDLDFHETQMEADVGFSIHFVFDEATPQLECREIALYCYGTGEVAEVAAPDWVEGQDPTVKMATKKVKRKGRTAEKVVVAKPVESFFRLFQLPDADDEADDERDEAELSVGELQEHVVALLREELVTRAGIYYIQSLSPDGEDWGQLEEDYDDWEPPAQAGRSRR